MIRPTHIAILLVLCCFNNANSQTSTYIEGGRKHTVAWDDMMGSIVEVDGLAWGAFDKGLGPHVVMANHKIYLENIDLIEADLNGRLVRITGVLRKSRVDPAPRGAQGYSQPFEYYYLDTVAVNNIDKVKLDQLRPSKDDWIVPGLSADAAAKLIADRNMQAYPLALAAEKYGSETHSHLVSDRVVVVYRIINGTVSSVSQINLNGIGKVDDDWVQLPGFRLPPLATSNER